VLETPKGDPPKHHALVISKKGSEEIILNVQSKDALLGDRILESVKSLCPQNQEIYPVRSQQFARDLLSVEEKHPQNPIQ